MELIRYDEVHKTHCTKAKEYIIRVAEDIEEEKSWMFREIEYFFEAIKLKFKFFPKIISKKSESFHIINIKKPRVADKVIILSISKAHGITHTDTILKRTGLISLIFRDTFMLIDTAYLPNSEGSLVLSEDMKTIYGILLPCTMSQQFEFGILYTRILRGDYSLTPAPKIHEIFPSIVKVFAKMTGSGVSISQNLIITNSHVAKNSKNIDIYAQDKKCEGKLKAAYNLIDLAKIEVERNIPIVEKAKEFIYGETVYAVGFGLFNPWELKCPIVTIGSLSKIVYYKNKPIAIQFTAQSFSGHSGGGVFNEKGELIGIIVSNAREREGNIIPTLNLCIPHTVFEDEELLNDTDPFITDLFNYETVRILPEPRL
ncbi:unnamed protein product [Blepharisma stoltei]|uniref:Serine protease n=1 Tax=Blepharisma stoltei TaxID=1481888 RepID=A0AAU9K465_9CILI|nr:unnamed protein product [Blepharisma stoltei]